MRERKDDDTRRFLQGPPAIPGALRPRSAHGCWNWVRLELRVTKSQVAFIHQKAFAWAWVPGKYLKGKTAPLVLTFSFRERDPSPRWKEIVEPYPGRFTHHLEIFNPADIDGEVRAWLRTAREGAGKVKSKSRG